jgi:lipopolysaccharide transport system ATP-binding protein
LRQADGTIIFSSANTDTEPFLEKEWLMGDFVERCHIPANLLTPGKYYLSISQPIASGTSYVHEDICFFAVDSSDSIVSRDGRQGAVAPILDWEIISSSCLQKSIR